MRRIALIAIISISIVANALLAQQSAAKPETEEPDNLPRVEEQLKVLNEKLGLTAKQQAKVKPILQQLHDATENVMRDQTLSREERLAKVRPHRQIADKKMRTILNDEQRKKLDQYEQGPHREVHGNLSGTPKPPAR
jgi:Spy/CpxP family protein refolding chaperone